MTLFSLEIPYYPIKSANTNSDFWNSFENKTLKIRQLYENEGLDSKQIRAETGYDRHLIYFVIKGVNNGKKFRERVDGSDIYGRIETEYGFITPESLKKAQLWDEGLDLEDISRELNLKVSSIATVLSNLRQYLKRDYKECTKQYHEWRKKHKQKLKVYKAR